MGIGMATVKVDGKRVPLTRDGVKSIKGDAGSKLRKALRPNDRGRGRLAR